MNTTLPSFVVADIAPDSLTLLTDVSSMIFQQTSQLEEAVAQKRLRFQQIYNHLQHSLYTIHLDPASLSIYKQSVSLLFDIYQKELANRNLKPDLLTIQQWLRIIRRLMTQEITTLYIHNHQSDSDVQNSFELSLDHSFTGCLLRTLSNLIPDSISVTEKNTSGTSVPLYSDFFDVNVSNPLMH